jgi:prepilin-type N-terminal cleavage/methylation domain-containing protein
VKKAFTLSELMVVVLIFTFLFSAILVIMVSSQHSWRIGQEKAGEQQEARRVADDIVRLLRQSKPEWVTIEPSGFPNRDKILFYQPVIDEGTGAVDPGDWFIYKPDPADARRLLKKKETGEWMAVAQQIESIRFNGGDCAGCNCDFSNSACSTCLSVTADCPLVRLQVESKTGGGFTLSTTVQLRNYTPTPGELPEPPAEGEF